MKSTDEIEAAVARKRAIMKPEEIDKLVKRHFGGLQAALAAMMDVSHVTIYNWVKGFTTPSRGEQMIMRQWYDDPSTIPEPAKQSA